LSAVTPSLPLSPETAELLVAEFPEQAATNNAPKARNLRISYSPIPPAA
jgi:hypothetical protein